MPKKILIADDDSDIRNLLSETLTQEGYEVTGVSDGKEAIQKIEEQFYHLLILDLEMPYFDGFQVADRIQARWRNNPPQILILTGHSIPDAGPRAILTGASAFVQKSCDMDFLIRKVQELIGK